MHIEWLFCVRSQCLHNIGANREVGHEVAIHYVEVHHVGAGLVDGTHFFSQARKVRGEDGRANQNCHAQALARLAARLNQS